MENPEKIVGKENTETALLMILIVIGIVAIVTLILALTSGKKTVKTDEIIVEGYQNQADEAVEVLKTLKKKMLKPEDMENEQHQDKIKSILEGEDLSSFSAKIDYITVDMLNLKYYAVEDFVYHKGGRKLNNGLEFYIEVKSSLKRSMEGQEEINQDLCLRLYSDGSIERMDIQENK